MLTRYFKYTRVLCSYYFNPELTLAYKHIKLGVLLLNLQLGQIAAGVSARRFIEQILLIVIVVLRGRGQAKRVATGLYFVLTEFFLLRRRRITYEIVFEHGRRTILGIIQMIQINRRERRCGS